MVNSANGVSSQKAIPDCAALHLGYGARPRGGNMLDRKPLALFALIAAFAMTTASAVAHDESKYPDWGGQWKRPRGVATQWDQTKPLGLAQQAPLKPEFQAVLEASIKDQAAGGQGNDPHVTCVSNGVPRIMTATFPIAFVITPAVTYIHFEAFMPRRVYTDGRAFPKDEEPSYQGYSIGKWLDTDGDGRYDTLEVETRNFKGPRTYEASGLPLHPDNESIILERISLDKDNPDLLHNVITSIDHALTRPWTITKTYRRDRNELWQDYNCDEANNHVVIGKENYFLSGDGLLMPTKKDQPPPHLRYFKQTRK